METLEQFEQFTRTWYKDIPEVGTEEFNRFCGQSISLFNTVAKTTKRILPSIQDIESAACIPGKLFILPLWYFNPNVWKSSCDSDAKATMVINGSTVHEALHFLFTKKTPDEIICAADLSEFGNALFQVFNIIEDIAIEAMGKDLFPAYMNFVDAKNTFLFSEESIAEAADTFRSDKSLKNAIELAVCYKRINTRSLDAWSDLPAGALGALQIASDGKTVELGGILGRLQLAKKFINAFPTSDREEVSKAGEGFAIHIAAIETSMLSAIRSERKMKVAIDGMAASGKPGIESVRLEVAEGAEDADEETEDEASFEFSSIDDPKFVSIFDSKPGTSDHCDFADGADFSFLRRVLLLRSKNHAVGEPLKRGTKIVNTRLYKIATDGKIFTNHSQMMNLPTRSEIIILVDASGSMRTTRGSGSLFITVVKTAFKMFETLKKANIPCAVYAHTSYNKGSYRSSDQPIVYEDQPIVYEVASHDMGKTTSNNEARFQRLSNVSTNQNYDGLVIAEVSKKFTHRSCPKLLIVLSDGRPSAPRYGGDEAEEHTSKMIKLARKTVNVICMSLVDRVVDANNDIYGKEFNVDASRDLEGEFERVLQHVIAP
jgi:hypothetical protein